MKEIHLDLYVDESKERQHNDDVIDYMMILAIPINEKQKIYMKINNARCLNDNNDCYSDICKNQCKYHNGNNTEIHYSEIQKDNTKFKIANKWVDILLSNEISKDIYYNIFGIVKSNLDVAKFGSTKQYGNVYNRFFYTSFLNVVNFFDEYDTIYIEHVYHDRTTEMEEHPYFKKSFIKKIMLSDNNYRNKVKFVTSEIDFIDSDHRIGDTVDSQFIQFADLILGLTCNVIHGDASNEYKNFLTKRIYELTNRMMNKPLNKNSRYDYYKKKTITFFPCYNKEEMIKKYKEQMYNENMIRHCLDNANGFTSKMDVLFDINPQCTQLTLFDYNEHDSLIV